MEQTPSGTPFLKIRIPRELSFLTRAFRWLLALCGATVLSLVAYAAKSWIDERIQTQTTSITIPLMSLIPKVQTLEEFKERDEKSTEKMQTQIQLIYVKLTAVETSQKDTKENTERILRRLDATPARR